MNEKMKKLVDKRHDIDVEIRALQLACSHMNSKAEYKSDTGNWSISDDRYWVEHRCNDCDLYWETRQ